MLFAIICCAKLDNDEKNSELIKKRINADIVKFLEAKGLEFVVSGPSQLIRYTMGTVRETKLESYP
jgi:hypothetical protein